ASAARSRGPPPPGPARHPQQPHPRRAAPAPARYAVVLASLNFPPPVTAPTRRKGRRRRPENALPGPSTAPLSDSEVDGLFRLGHHLELDADAELVLDLLLDLVRKLGIVLEEPARVLLTLAELVALVGVPGT